MRDSGGTAESDKFMSRCQTYRTDTFRCISRLKAKPVLEPPDRTKGTSAARPVKRKLGWRHYALKSR